MKGIQNLTWMEEKVSLPPLPKILPRRPYAGRNGYIAVSSPDEIDNLLRDRDTVDLALSLWDSKSGYAGALNGNAVLSDKGVFQYEIGNHPARSIRNGVIRMSNSTRRDINLITTQMVKGEKSEEEWYEDMQKIIVGLLLASWLIGIGGVRHYDTQAMDTFYRKAMPQMRWLDNFASAINAGAPLNGATVIRAMSYGRAPYALWQTGTLETARRQGWRKAKRVLGETENHCHDHRDVPGCIELAAQGWVSLQYVIPIGQAVCRQNCLCHFEFMK